MCRLSYYLLILVCALFRGVYGANDTAEDVPLESLIDLTGGNELWTSLLTNCEKPTLACVKTNVYDYFKQTLDNTSDIEFTSYLKFSKNDVDYGKISKSFGNVTDDEDFSDEDESPIEAMSRSLRDDSMQFFMTHDIELSLPDGIFPNSVVKISPRSFEDEGTLVKFDVVPDNKGVEEGRLFKKIRKFITERLLYALLAILLVIKLLAVKFLFLLPLIVGAATAKKLLLKILLFIFPALHHLFKFCAYYPIQAKYHHHKHLISHIHEFPHHHHHPHHDEGVEVVAPHEYGPPVHHHHENDDFDLEEGIVVPDNGIHFGHDSISHRRDPTRFENELEPWGSHEHSPVRRYRPKRPLTNSEIDRMVAKAEREALIKSRLQKEKLRIREENFRLQEQLNQALKLQEKLKQQAAYLHAKLPPQLPPGSGTFPYRGDPVADYYPRGSSVDTVASHNLGNKESPVYVPQHHVLTKPVGNIRESEKFDSQHKTPFKPSTQLANNNVPQYSPEYSTSAAPVSLKPKLEKEIYQAASITYDPFYTPILEKVDRIFNGLGYNEEPCKERLICSMYKNPSKFSPHSNLISAEISRDATELKKPTATNSAVIRFYKYVQSARDGQDGRDCLRLYPACNINTEL
ncbi:uncharacterized protein LOC132703206 [Cylas formicarius]|uniref:uncharacterized protein LOC132703206 n=1 Tax=Cylas formicarius TaxID=197179 RepID=UPI002958BF3B|nr:uncharacterized protein LOC132703206 [Cylas formicarius]